jgi:hypothetical protein
MSNKLLPNYGWVQNTSNLVTIRETLLLVPEYGIKHIDLREKIKEYRQKQNNLPYRWTWDARCRIKAVQALGLVKINRNIQGYDLTELGKRLKKIDNHVLRNLSTEEIKIFKSGLLTNPPVIRVLSLLNNDFRDKNNGLTKYDLGASLGFVGDIGFTHLDPYWVVNNNFKFNDKEGDADKWARTIISWLIQVGWVHKAGHTDISGKKLIKYKTTDKINNILRYDINRIARNVPIEMLCSNHHPFPKLIQKRRSIILNKLSSLQQTKKNLIDALKLNDIDVDNVTIEFEILNLKQTGFRIIENGGYYKLLDDINLDVPIINKIEKNDNSIEKLIEEFVVKYERSIPPRLIDQLIRYGYNGKYGKEFESSVGEYFRFLGYNITQLGQGKGKVADVLARYVHPDIYAKSYAIIIDAKATLNKYNFPVGDTRKMKEYINTHGPELAKETITNHAFSFVSSSFVDNSKKYLMEISKNTHINGCAIEVLQLLELGNKLKNQKLAIANMFKNYTTNSIFKL